ncbi:YwqG family protein [Dactylosporangium sp. NPDC049742]|uniref:YwqG family protein n=1 Tax=Dactylosporangium sp. NPDC049742 TaxID=3154737 RepID=UPI003444C789
MSELRGEVGGDEALWGVLAPHVLPSVRLTGGGACAPDSRGTRLGGEALAGDGFVWPRTDGGRALTVIAQLDCDEINATLGGGGGPGVLPAGALLTFFYDAVEMEGWGYDPGHRQHWRVVVSDAATARPVVAPEGTEAFGAVACVPRRVLTIPDRWEPAVERLREHGRGAVSRLYDRVGVKDEAPRHRVFGWPELVQGPMQLECQLAADGISVGGPEGYDDPRVEGLREGAADWVLLLQIDSDDAAGWMWGDVGTLYYWIRSQDLAAGDFTRIWGIGQCC